MKTVKTILVSLLALLVACLAVFSVSYFTSDLRRENIQKEHEKMMRLLLPGSENFVFEPYAGNDESVLSVHKAENGYVVETMHQGYNGKIVMMVGVNNDGFVTGLVVRDMNETMGLGQKALYDHKFLSQFLNTSTDAKVGETVDAITGATVTSKTVQKCISSAVAVVTGADTTSTATTWGG
ncbi:MAG: FMN-binding protein [Clostridia bacterium]|nr:FMN-binding protein [Clostridia bacterium]